MDLFKEVVPSLLQTKKSVITPENEKQYDAYMTNRALSQHSDCILYVNEMNKFYNLDNKLQYDFYFFVLHNKKRPFQKWYKAEDNYNIKAIKEYFGYSSEKAKDVLRILTEEQLIKIKDVVDKRGIIK